MEQAVPPSAQRIVAGRYALGELLGQGGMGEVRAGRDLRLDREVAVKLLRPDMAVQESVRLRFESEARSAARLVHPNVVAVFDTGEDDGIPFLVMERLSGRTLADQIGQGPTDQHVVRLVGLQILAALGAAHRAGIVHRDVKPGNVLVAGPEHWKVGDFGIAKSLEVSELDRQDLTVTGLVMGTPAYLAPERLAGGPATPASDLYAVGVVLYEALTGRKPLDPAAAPAAVFTSSPPPIDELRPDIDARLAGAVMRSLEKDPAARFSTAADMASAVGASAVPHVVAVPPVSVRSGSARTQAPVPALDATVAQPVSALDATVAQPVPVADPTVAQPVAVVHPTVAQPVPAGSDGARWLPLVVAFAVVAVVLIALVSSLGHHAQARTPPPPTTAPQGTPASSLPAPLDSALQHLQRLVQP